MRVFCLQLGFGDRRKGVRRPVPCHGRKQETGGRRQVLPCVNMISFSNVGIVLQYIGPWVRSCSPLPPISCRQVRSPMGESANQPKGGPAHQPVGRPAHWRAGGPACTPGGFPVCLRPSPVVFDRRPRTDDRRWPPYSTIMNYGVICRLVNNTFHDTLITGHGVPCPNKSILYCVYNLVRRSPLPFSCFLSPVSCLRSPFSVLPSPFS